METNNGQIDQSIASQQRIEYLKQRLIIAKEKGHKTEVFQAYNNLAQSYFYHGDYKEAIEYCKLSLNIAKEIGNRNKEGEAYVGLGVCYQGLGDYKQALEYQKQNLTIAKEVGNRRGEGQAYRALGNCYERLGDYKQAGEYQKLSLSIAKEIGNRRGEGQAYWGLSNCYQGLGDYKQALEYEKLSLSIAKEVGSRHGEGLAYGGLGNCYQRLGDYKQALEYEKLSLSIAKEVGNRYAEGRAYENLGFCYQGLGDYKEAMEYHKLSLSIAKEVGNRRGEGQAYGDLGNCYQGLGDYKQAVEYHKLSLSIAKEVGNRNQEGIVYGGLGNCYHGLGDYKQAVDYYTLSLSIAKEVGHKRREKQLYVKLGKLCGVLGEVEQAIKYNKLYLYMGETAGVERTGGGLQFGDIAGEEHTHYRLVPNEIKARGPKAKLAYENALKNGKVKVYLARIMFIGQARAGKTSLKKSLLGMSFDPEEQSTVGIEVDPSSFKVDVDQVKNWQCTDEKLGVPQFTQELARMAAGELDKDEAKVDLNAHDVPIERSHTNQVLVNEDKTYDSKDSAIPSSPEKVEEAAAVNDQDDRHTDENGENAAKVPQLKIDPTLPPEEFTQYLIQHLGGLNLHTDTPSAEAPVILDLWDFAGQHLYYASHPVFLSRRAIYLLVCNLSKGLNDTAEPYVRQGIHNVRLENRSGQTNLDDLLSWLVSVSATCSKKQEAAEKELPYLRPPVFIVGTHADKPCHVIKEMELEIQKNISEKYCSRHVIRPFVSIDNTRSSADAGVRKLQEGILKVLKQEPYIGEEVPVRWFIFKKVIQELVAVNVYHLNIDQLKTIVQEVCLIDDEDEVTTMLDFYHDLGHIIKHRSTIVLEAQWLIDVFKQLITIRPFKDMDPCHTKYWDDLEKEGVLNMEFVDHVFSKFQQQRLVKEDILDLMEKFGLIARFATSPNDVKYFVPAQLKSPPEGLFEIEPSSADPCPLYLHFVDDIVPHGLFTQLVSRSISWCSETGCTQPPKLYQNGAWFVIGEQIIHDLFLTFRRRYIKVVARQKTQSHQGSSCKFVEVGLLVREFLESTLQKVSLNLPYLSGLQHQFCVACPYCLQASRKCSKHSQISCTHDDCLHLLEIKQGKKLICMETLCDKVYTVHGMDKWFPENVPPQETPLSLPKTSKDTPGPRDKVKQGIPTNEELEELGIDIGEKWKRLGRRLGVEEKLPEIDHAHGELSEKGYQMLRHWKQMRGLSATYQALCSALTNKLVQCQDLAEKFCYICDPSKKRRLQVESSDSQGEESIKRQKQMSTDESRGTFVWQLGNTAKEKE